MRITESARKRVIGPARVGAVLEVGVIEDDDDPRIIHAMPARRKFWP